MNGPEHTANRDVHMTGSTVNRIHSLFACTIWNGPHESFTHTSVVPLVWHLPVQIENQSRLAIEVL